jgi:hypothetical protein
MAVTAITLTDPASGISVPIMPAVGVAAQILDVAAPARAVAVDRVGAHGSFDTTAFYGPAAVSLTMLLYPDGGITPEAFLDQLGQLLNPALRPVLVVTNDAWALPRQITVRFDSVSVPVSDPTNQPVQVTWTGPRSVWEDAVEVTATIGAFIASATGLTWDVTSGITWTSAGVSWPASTSPSPQLVTNTGTLACDWVGFLYGPATGPKIANDTAGGALEFDDSLILPPGEYVLLDSSTRTAYRNGDLTQPVTGNLTFPAVWWLMQPGVNNVRYYPSAAGGGAAAQLAFRPARPVF